MKISYFISGMNMNQIVKTFFLILLAFGLLTGCGKSDQGSKSNSLVDNTVRKYTKQVTLSGSVINDTGPVSAGRVEAADNKDAIVSTAVLEKSGHYSIVIPAGTQLPIVLTAYPETDQSGDEKLMVAVIEPALKKYDISSLTTAIAEKARSLGGYTYANMQQAAMSSTSIPDANKTSGGFRGDPTKQYGGWH